MGIPITGRGGVGRRSSSQVGGHTGGANEYTEPLVPGGRAKCLSLGWSPVCRIYVYLIGYAKGAQGVQRLPNDRQVAVAAHENANFFHRRPPCKMKKGAHLPPAVSVPRRPARNPDALLPPWCSTSSVSYRASAILTHPVYHIPAWPSNGKCSELKGIIPAVPVNYVKNRT